MFLPLALRKYEFVPPVTFQAQESVTIVTSPGREVDRSLRIRGQNDQVGARLQGAHGALGHGQRNWAHKPTRVDGRHNRRS